MSLRGRHNVVLRCAVLMSLFLLAGCAIEDDRDVCCGNVVMEYSYTPYGVEELSECIHSMRHFLFDGDGRYVSEVGDDGGKLRQRVALSAGEYTMVTVGNMDRPLNFDASDGTLQTLEMELSARSRAAGGGVDDYDNSDELYWGICRMSVRGSGNERFVTHMSNIHCHLAVRVIWYNMPEYVGDYRMELDNVSVGYALSPDRTYVVGDKVMPASNGHTGRYVVTVPLRAQELQTEFVTLRYSDDRLPCLRLWFGDTAVTGPIDLGRAFETWGWRADAAAVQEYRIQLTIYSDNTVEVKPWVEADVEDWQDGGSFG